MHPPNSQIHVFGNIFGRNNLAGLGALDDKGFQSSKEKTTLKAMRMSSDHCVFTTMVLQEVSLVLPH